MDLKKMSKKSVKDYTVESFKKLRADLRQITRDCRLDMHEPDEQEVYATVVGNHLDNAMGNRIDEQLLTQGSQEFVVILHRRDGSLENFPINLASLIALAKGELDLD